MEKDELFCYTLVTYLGCSAQIIARSIIGLRLLFSVYIIKSSIVYFMLGHVHHETVLLSLQ